MAKPKKGGKRIAEHEAWRQSIKETNPDLYAYTGLKTSPKPGTKSFQKIIEEGEKNVGFNNYKLIQDKVRSLKGGLLAQAEPAPEQKPKTTETPSNARVDYHDTRAGILHLDKMTDPDVDTRPGYGDGVLVNRTTTPEPTRTGPGVLGGPSYHTDVGRGAIKDELDLLLRQRNVDTASRANAQPDTSAHSAPKQTPMTDTQISELQEARNHFKSRKPRSSKFYDAEDWRAWRIIKAHEKRIGTGETTWGASPAYNIYDKQQRSYANELNIYAKEKYGAGTKEYKQFMEDYSLDRGHINPKGNRGFSHQMDVTSNIGPEVRTINRGHGARMSFREWLEGMHQADMEQTPRIRAETERRLMKLSSEVGENTPLGSHIKYLRSLPKFKGLDPEFADNKFLDINMFDSDTQRGVFIRNMGEMIESGDIKNAHEYERMRRFFLTAMDGNQEFDLRSFMNETGVVPREFREGLPEGGKPSVGWEEVVSGNKQAARQLGNRKKLLGLLSKHGVGTPAAILALMTASGATYAADDSDNASYIEHLIDKLERYDAISSAPGEQTILQGADKVGAGGFLRGVSDWYNRNMAQVPESATKFVSQLLWEMGKDVVTEPVGIVTSAIKTPVAPPENQSWLESQRSVYNQGVLRNNWT